MSEHAQRDLGGVTGLGATVRALRERRELSQATLASFGRMHEDSVGAIERGEGKNPSVARVCRLARGLGVSASVLTAGFVWPYGSNVPLAHAETDGTLHTPRTTDAQRLAPDATRAIAMGMVLAALRASSRRPLPAIARAAGTSPRYAASLERGAVSNPGLATLVRLAAALRSDGTEGHAVLDARVALMVCVFAAELTAAAAIRHASRTAEPLAREHLGLNPKGL